MTEDQVAFYIVMGLLALITVAIGGAAYFSFLQRSVRYQAYPRKRQGPPDA